MKKSFAVFGLGHFGGTIVKEFHEMGIEVVAIDKDEVKVNEYMNYATHVVCAKTNDETILKQLGIHHIDHVFVSFGDEIQSSILTSLLLKDIGVRKVWTKAQNDSHAKVLEKIGVDKVINPERDMAKRIAHLIVSDKMIDFIELSKDYSMVEIIATQKLDQHSLRDLQVRAKYGCTIVGIKREGRFIISPSAEEVIYKDDVLVVIGNNQDIQRFEEDGV
jgi:trk system potassium uptake protein TrkA